MLLFGDGTLTNILSSRVGILERYTASASRRKPVNNHHRPTQISAEFKAELEKDLAHLRNDVRPAIAERLKSAREGGDITDNAAFEQALTTAGIEHELVVYDGAPHSFFDRKQTEFAEASDDAWRRSLAFIDANA